MGRGNKVGRCPGNLNFRRVCWKYKAQYLQSYKEEKSRIASAVLEEISKLDPPGRFLEPHGNCYMFVHPNRALEKTCQLLREKKVKKPNGMESLPMRRIQVNKCLRRRKSVKAIDYQKCLSSEEEKDHKQHSDGKIKPNVVTSAKKTVKKKKTPSKAKHTAKGSHEKVIAMKKAIRSIGKTPRKSKRQVVPRSTGNERISKIEKKDTEEAKVQVQVKSSESTTSMILGEETKLSSSLIHPITPPSSFYFGTPAIQSVMAFEAESCYLPDDPEDDKPIELLHPSELLRGLSEYTFQNEPGEGFEDSDFETELEKITEPPPLTSFSSRGTSLCSVHLGFERTTNTFEDKARESPIGVIDIPGPPMLKSNNSLLIDGIDAGESEDSAIPSDVFEDERHNGVKRKLWY